MVVEYSRSKSLDIPNCQRLVFAYRGPTLGVHLNNNKARRIRRVAAAPRPGGSPPQRLKLRPLL
jgi:hypothetical protein